MTEKDIDAVVNLETEIFSDAWTKTSISETLSQQQAILTVAEETGTIVAYCILYYVLDEGEIARIAVSPQKQHMGIGKKLLNYTCDLCLEQGVSRLLLDVRESNAHARTFYKAYGFSEDGIRRNFYQFPIEHAILMSKNIG